MTNQTKPALSILFVVFMTTQIPAQTVSDTLFNTDRLIKTRKHVYDAWEKSDHSEGKNIDTIACVFWVELVDLDLSFPHLIKDVKFELSEGENGIYDCDCYIFDKKNNVIASIGFIEGYKVLPNFSPRGNSLYGITERIITKKDSLILFPQAKNYVLNAQWYLLVDSTGETKWLNTENSSEPYSWYEVQQGYQNALILSKY